MVRNNFKQFSSQIYKFLFQFYIPFQYHFQLPFPTIINQHLSFFKTFKYFPMQLIKQLKLIIVTKIQKSFMKSKQQLKEKFNQLTLTRINQTARLSAQLNELVVYMEYIIKKDFQSFNLFSFSICSGSGRTFKVSPQFQNAFKGCNVGEKIEYYEVVVNYINDFQKQTSIKAYQQEMQIEEITIKIIKGLKIKEPIKIKISRLSLDCKNYQIDLNTYLLRRSKKQNNVYLFDTIKQQEPVTIRLELVEASPLKTTTLIQVGKRCFRQFLAKINSRSEFKTERKEIKLFKSKSKTAELNQNSMLQKNKKNGDNQIRQTQDYILKQNLNNKSLIEQLVENSPQNFNQGIYQYLQRRQQQNELIQSKSRVGRIHKNQLNTLLPHYNLENLQAYHDFVLYQKNEVKKMFIYYSQRYNSYKLELVVNNQTEKIVSQLCQVQNQKLWNQSINESQVKWAITSQNAYIVYRKQKSLSQWYRQRDFIFIKYLFKKNNSFYMVDRSIQDTYFIPFQTIHRGYIRHCICRVDQFTNKSSKILMQLSLEYGGMLTKEQQKQLTLSYLRQYVNFQTFLQNFNTKPKNLFDINWQIEDMPFNGSNNSFASINSDIFQQDLQPIDVDDEQSFYSIVQQTERIEVTVEEKMLNLRVTQIKEYINQQIRLNEEGFAILPKSYLKVRHPNAPKKVPQSRKKITYENIMLKNDFVIDKEGGMLLVNQARIAAQNNVLKFIMSTLKKNLFSGKGILNISLPVQIFNSDSNLQRLCQSMALAPELIEKKAVQTTDSLQRFKNCIAFALSNSILYFDIDKPFNPILGETFQGVIDGCPIYAQQISHHPPISSILFYGRGYKIYANLQAKVYVHLNSGQGVNEGLYTVEFDDGEKIVFQTAPGQITGLAVGDRKYRIKGKMIVLDPKNRLCSCINFQEETGLFAAKKWKFTDQMEGDIVKVTDGFVRNFFGGEVGKDLKGPSKKQIEQTLGKVEGRWIQKLVIDGKVYYDINWLPYQMIHYEFPLNSNSNYRQDLIYRKANNLARSQQQKERLQVLQRNDRKLRQKYGGKSH